MEARGLGRMQHLRPSDHKSGCKRAHSTATGLDGLTACGAKLAEGWLRGVARARERGGGNGWVVWGIMES